MKISVLTSDFSHNCFARAWLLAKVLKRHYDVEIIGPTFGEGIWKPLENLCDFETKTVKRYAGGRFEFKKMLNMISGDVIYASKPLMASFGVGLVKKIVTHKPLVLDIDDWELGLRKELYDSLVWRKSSLVWHKKLLFWHKKPLAWHKKINKLFLSTVNYQSNFYVLILNELVRFADTITVAGNVLRSKYGGTVVWHGRDVNTFNPAKFNNADLRRKYLGSRSKNTFIVSFIGTPRPQKGLEDLIDAMSLISKCEFLLMFVGRDEANYFTSIKKRAKELGISEKLLLFPERPFSELPELLAITDLIVIPQVERKASHAQVPAKIFDAMAMAKPIISTNVSDVPEILDGCGWIVKPEDPRKLAETIQYVFDHPLEAKEKGKKAREKCIREYSWGVMEKVLISIFEKYE